MATQLAEAREDLVLVNDAEDGVRVVTLNRPDKLNSFTSLMIGRLHEVLEAAVEDPSVRVIVLRGNGRAFCAGGDIDEMLARGALDGLGRKNNLWNEIQRIPLLLDRSEKPIIAAMQGACRGAGVDLGLMCDIRIASRSAEFAETYVNLGIVSGAGGSWFLPRIVGAARALEMFWTGEAVDADEALAIGLVSRVVADDELEEAAVGLAVKIARQPQAAVGIFRRAVYQSQATPLWAHLDMISSHMSVLRDTPDHRARIAAIKRRLI